MKQIETSPAVPSRSSISTRGSQVGEVTALAQLFEYLDELRESGRTNMFGAATYLEHECGLTLDDARIVLRQWMDTFSAGAMPPMDRARAAISKATGETR